MCGGGGGEELKTPTDCHCLSHAGVQIALQLRKYSMEGKAPIAIIILVSKNEKADMDI